MNPFSHRADRPGVFDLGWAGKGDDVIVLHWAYPFPLRGGCSFSQTKDTLNFQLRAKHKIWSYLTHRWDRALYNLQHRWRLLHAAHTGRLC